MNRLVPDIPFPPYAYVPGQSPHPVSDPEGHSYGKRHDTPPPLDPERWWESRAYLHGIDLFNHGYHWEAHEVWEGLWLACGRSGVMGDFLKGLIQTAAACVKVRQGVPRGVASLSAGAAALFQRVADTLHPGSRAYLCLDLDELIRLARGLPSLSGRGGNVPEALPVRIIPSPLPPPFPMRGMFMSKLPDPLVYRTADHPIEQLFLLRWSPRAMSGEALSAVELKRLFEAARWAPSTYNEQEWRFLYARRDTPHFPTFFDLLVEGNKSWCHRAAVLMVVLSHKVFRLNGKPNPVHTFDSGAAFENLALQGSSMGLVVHGMAGFDRDKARSALGVPDDYDVEAMVAVGKPGDPAELPEGLREHEVPTGRMKVEEFTREGPFSF